MKKAMLLILFFSLLSVIYGKYIISLYNSKKVVDVTNESENMYILQQGVYSTIENAKNNSKDLNYYTIEKYDKYYRVYVAISQSEKNVEKIKGIYAKNGKDIYVWQKSISNNAFFEILKQYDSLLNEKSEEKDILEIEKQVIAKYEELVIRKNGEDD